MKLTTTIHEIRDRVLAAETSDVRDELIALCEVVGELAVHLEPSPVLPTGGELPWAHNTRVNYLGREQREIREKRQANDGPPSDAEREAWKVSNVIPAITEPMGRFWEQPDRSKILIDDTHALMTRATFEELAEYSASNPSVAYEGKMWKRHDGDFDKRFMARGGVPTWLLCWFGESQIGPEYVSNNYRKILLVDGELPDDGHD